MSKKNPYQVSELPQGKEAGVRHYRADPLQRRLSTYVMLGCLFACAIITLGALINLQRDLLAALTVLSFALIPAIGICLSAGNVFWRLRIDDNGVTWRWLFLSDTWTWLELESGWLEKIAKDQIYDTMRPWGWRKLRLDWLSAEDAREVMAIINKRYALPPVGEGPRVLTLRQQDQTQMKLSEEGIFLVRAGIARMYRWADVCEIQIARFDTVRRDFTELLIILPDELIAFAANRYGRPNWKGASDEEINDLLNEFASEKIRVCIQNEAKTMAVQWWSELETQR
ncbi:MAG: hypothetical protein NXI22_15915, partial [bacterium]|nr:hypothetical protein [bacterium]